MNEERGLPWVHDGIEAWMTPTETAQLQKLAYGRYCEIGTYQGHSLMAVLPRVKHAIGIDPKEYPSVSKLKKKHHNKLLFLKRKAEYLDLMGGFDVLFIDGNHDRVALDFAYYFPKVKVGGTIIFHDYYHLYPKVIALVDSLPYEIHHLESLAWFIKTHI